MPIHWVRRRACDSTPMMILNLTQHQGTPEQGVTELPPQERAALLGLLTFDEPPSAQEIGNAAMAIAELAVHNGLGPFDGEDPIAHAAMIGGAPFLMSALERELQARGIKPLYAFSRRESVEQVQPDGSVRKVAVFRHAGWVEVEPDPVP